MFRSSPVGRLRNSHFELRVQSELQSKRFSSDASSSSSSFSRPTSKLSDEHIEPEVELYPRPNQPKAQPRTQPLFELPDSLKKRAASLWSSPGLSRPNQSLNPSGQSDSTPKIDCDQYVNATSNANRSGQLMLRWPSSLNAGQSCNVHFTSSNAFDRIWFYFSHFETVSGSSGLQPNAYDVAGSTLARRPSLNSLNGPCTHSNRLQLFEPIESERLFAPPAFTSIHRPTSVESLRLTDEFCDRHPPKRCTSGGAPISQPTSSDSIPGCVYPEASYLTSGSQLRLSQLLSSRSTPGIHAQLHYEFINTQEFGEPIPNTRCDRLFDSGKFKHGTVRSSRNLFLYGRVGGRSRLSCAYMFKAAPGQQLRIQLYRIKVRSSECIQRRDPQSGLFQCDRQPSGRSPGTQDSQSQATFSVWDQVDSDHWTASTSAQSPAAAIQMPVSCFCNKTVNFLTPVSFHLIGGLSILNFTVEAMKSHEDFNDFAFEAFYEFLPNASWAQTDFQQTLLGNTQQFNLNIPGNFSFDYYQEFKTRKRLWTSNFQTAMLNVNGYWPKK